MKQVQDREQRPRSLRLRHEGGALGPVENGAPRAVAQVALPTEVGAAAFAKTPSGLPINPLRSRHSQ